MFITLGKGIELSLSYTIPWTFYTKNKFKRYTLTLEVDLRRAYLYVPYYLIYIHIYNQNYQVQNKNFPFNHNTNIIRQEL